VYLPLSTRWSRQIIITKYRNVWFAKWPVLPRRQWFHFLNYWKISRWTDIWFVFFLWWYREVGMTNIPKNRFFKVNSQHWVFYTFVLCFYINKNKRILWSFNLYYFKNYFIGTEWSVVNIYTTIYFVVNRQWKNIYHLWLPYVLNRQW